MKVTLKIATSMDARIAMSTGESKWITGAEAREAVHEIRARHDAVLAGIGTVLADDPQLNVRLPGQEAKQQPHRIVLDSELRIPATARLLSVGSGQVFVFTSHDSETEKAAALRDAGVNVIPVERKLEGGLEIREVLTHLGEYGIGSVMIEGGGQVAASALREGCIDCIEWFRAPILIGSEGRPAIGELRLDRLAGVPRFTRTGVRTVGDDLWETYEKREN